jgi:hypothetical protein
MFIKGLLWVSLILPWFSLVFMQKEGIKRYMPVYKLRLWQQLSFLSMDFY